MHRRTELTVDNPPLEMKEVGPRAEQSRTQREVCRAHDMIGLES